MLDIGSNPDHLDSDIDENNNFGEESSRISKKRGPRVDDHFQLPSLGDLKHPHVDWIIDEVTMNEYLSNYVKQEGFAFTRIKDGMRVYWRCVHAGRYRNRNNLPLEVTEKESRQELRDEGIIPLLQIINA